MNFKILGLLFCLCAVLLSCTNGNDKYQRIIVDNVDYTAWDSLLKIEEVIPLGNEKDSLLMSMAQKCIVGKKRILFWDYKAKVVYAFDRQGDFLFTVGGVGHAENEYVNLRDVNFSSDESKIELLDVGGIKVYDAETGDFVERKLHKEVDAAKFYSFIPCENNSYLLFAPSEDFSIYKVDEIGHLTGLRESKGYQFIYNHFLYAEGNYVVCPDYGQFTIDYYVDGILEPQYEIDFAGQNLPENHLPEDFKTFNKVDNMKNYFKSILSVLESKDYLYLRAVGPAQIYYDVFYNKAMGLSYAGPADRKTNFLVTGLDGGMFYALIYPDFISEESFMYSLLDTYIQKSAGNPFLIKFRLNEEI